MRPLTLGTKLVLSAACSLALVGGPSATAAPAPPVSAPAPQQAWHPVTRTAAPAANVASVATFNNRLIALVNYGRTVRGLRPLRMSSCATAFAAANATRMASRNVMAHQPISPIVSGCRARWVGENIAWGYVNADQMYTNWMRSPVHRANILNPRFTHLGTGSGRRSDGRTYGAQVFLQL